jgi:4-hydroxy-tetrahydrodipicolinate reductase
MSDERIVPVIIVGARGRMGKALIRAVMDSENLALAGAVDRSGGPGTGLDAGRLAGLPDAGVTVSDELEPRRGTVVIDFSLPEATLNNVRRCVDAGAALVLGTTGVSPEALHALRAAAQRIPILAAANFSVGITLLLRLAAIAARALGPGWDAEIFELHHRHKRDAPSGTALRIGKAVARATGRELEQVGVFSRGGADRPRGDDEIGMIALRGGDSVGEHTLLLLGDGERLELTHRARDRGIFAQGAIRAAHWLADRPPGLYDMADVLGIKTP